MQRLFRLMVGRTARNSAITIGSNLIYGLSIIVFTIIVSRALGPEQFGLFSIAIAFFVLSFDVLNLGTSQALVRFVSVYLGKHQPHLAHQFARTVLLLRLAQVITVMTIAVILGKFIAFQIYQQPTLTLPLIISFTLSGGILLGDFYVNFLQGYERFGAAGILFLTNALVRFIGIIALLISHQLSITTAIFVFALGPWATALAGLITAPRQYLFVHTTPTTIKKLFNFSKWLSLWGISAALAGRLDVILLGKLTSIHETGIYAAASRLATGYILIGSAYASVLTPKISRIINKPAEFRRQMLLIAKSISLIIIGMAIVAISSTWIIPLVFGPKYIESVSIFHSLTLASVFFVSSLPASVSLLALGKAKFIGLLSLLQLLVLVILSFQLIPQFGAQGAAISLGSAYFTTFIISSSYAFKKIYAA